MDSPVDEIKNKLDVVDVISGYINLKKAGKDYKAKCPFHNEKTPSFFVSPSKQIWHCFGCNLGGDIFSFVMQIEGVEFADALKILAKKAGVILKKQDPKLRSQRSKLYEISQEAVEFFEENLKKNKIVQDYLKKRGISSTSIKDFRIGYALDSWDALFKHLTELGYGKEEIEKTGLIIKKQKYYDRFRKRIMFPIYDISEQVVGFTGRIFSSQDKARKGDESTAKYINSPESLIFNKSRILYGLNKTRLEIRKKEQCILTEGQTDVIMSYQAGIKNVVATSGTALTLDHLRIIKRYTDNLLLAFDPDRAGEEAAKKGINLAQKAEFDVGIIILPEGKDPADIIKESPSRWKKAIENARPIMEFYFEKVFSRYDIKKLKDKRQIAKELLPPIKRIANEIERAHWLQALALKLNVQEKLLIEALAKVKNPDEETSSLKYSNYQPEIELQTKVNKISLEKLHFKNIEENLLAFIFKHPEHLDYLKENLKKEYFTTLIGQKTFEELLKQKSNKKIDFKKLQKKLLLKQSDYFNQILFRTEQYNLDEKDILEEIKFYVKQIKSNYLKKKLSELSLAIKKVELDGEKKKVKNLTKKFIKLSEGL